MTWHIPAWYRGSFSRTPYAALERWRRLPRVIGYTIYAPQVVLLVIGTAAAAANPEFVAARFVDLRPDNAAPLSTGELFLLQLGVLGYFLAPAYFVMWLTTIMHKKRIRQLSGRCLACGESRMSEFLDECSACGSSFVEQDNSRSFIHGVRSTSDLSKPANHLTRKSTLRFAPLRRRVPGSGPILRLGVQSLVLVAVLIMASAIWIYVTDDGLPGPVPISKPLAAFILSIMSVFLPIGLLNHWTAVRHTVNLRRLRMRCIECERPLTDGDRSCAACGSSIVEQQLYIREAVKQTCAFRRYRGDRTKLARELGVPQART